MHKVIKMFLTRQEEQLLNGEHGVAVQLAMSVLVKLGEMYGADRMIQINNVHIDASSYYGIYDAGLEFCEKLAEENAKYQVPTTLCIASIDFERHAEFDISPECVEKQLRIANAHKKMGAVLNWTCAPYQCGNTVRFGQNIAWGESNAIAFVNSVIGARTIRCADFVDICAAITGRVPEIGLHLTRNRAAEVLLQLDDITAELQQHDSFYPVLGYVVGEIAGDRVRHLALRPLLCRWGQARVSSRQPASGPPPAAATATCGTPGTWRSPPPPG